MSEGAPPRARRTVAPGSTDPLADVGTEPGDPDATVVRRIVEICGRTDKARALERTAPLLAELAPLAAADLAVHLGRRARRLVVAVWAAGGDPVFIDGAGRLVTGVPPDLGPAVGQVLRRRVMQGAEAWLAVAGSAGADADDLVVALGALVESLVDDLAGALDAPRHEVEDAVWTDPPLAV